LALYPQTSCFYKGIVESIPRIGKDSYSIIFEDSSYNSGYSPEFDVPQMFVVAYKDVKK
jgi:SAGA-associated factor 29